MASPADRPGPARLSETAYVPAEVIECGPALRQVALFGKLLPEIAQSLFGFVMQRFPAEPFTDLLIGFGISFAIEVFPDSVVFRIVHFACAFLE